MAAALIMVYLLLVTPLRAGALLAFKEGGLHGAVGVTVWGVRLQARLRFVRDESGHPQWQREKDGFWLPLGKRAGRPRQGLLLLSLLRKGNRDGTPWKRLIQVTALRLQIRIGGENAARAALITGLLRSVFSLFPKAHADISPAFNGQTEGSFLCIAQARLGMLLAWGLGALLRPGRKEEHTWIIPSEP